MDATECRARTNVRWGGKDGKWRWLAVVEIDNSLLSSQEVYVGSRAGEERRLPDALMAAANAAEEILDAL